MDVTRTTLATKDKQLAIDLENKLEHARSWGACMGVQRIELICNQYDKIPPDAAYQVIDLPTFQLEVEEAILRSPSVSIAQYARHIFSLLPIIGTWFALFIATKNYNTQSTIPFLQQWQSFPVTFTETAVFDASFLILYLVTIIWCHRLDQIAQKKAIDYIHNLEISIDELTRTMQSIAIGPIRSVADIDKVTIAIKTVIDGAIAETKLLTQEARNAIQTVLQTSQQAIISANQRTEDLFTVKIIPIITKFDTTATNLQNNLTLFHTDITTLTNQTQQLTTNTSSLLSNLQNYMTIGQTMNQHITTLNTTEQNLTQQLTGLSQNITTALSSISTASKSLEQATQSVTAATQTLDRGVQATTTTMIDSVARATKFQNDLATFQQHLTNLATTLQTMSGSVTTFGSNVQTYANIGKNIDTEIKLFNTNQQTVIQQLNAVGGTIGVAAGSLKTTNSELSKTSQAIQTITPDLTNSVNLATTRMTDNIDRANISLKDTEQQLSITSTTLKAAADTMDKASKNYAGGYPGGYGSGGLLDWLIGHNKKSKAKKP